MPTPSYNLAHFNSRRSPVFSRRGMVAASQPLASLAGIHMLLRGGNAVDAAVAAAAVLGVVEPYQTGLGGDAFALIYLAGTREVKALNASGPAPAAARLDDYRARGLTAVPEHSPLAWTVPGCVDGWCQMLERHGRLSLPEVLEAAIQYAEDGFPVAPGDAFSWQQSEGLLRQHPESKMLLCDGRAPRPGDVILQRDLARTLRLLARGGRDEFYRGEIAERLVTYSRQAGGLLTREDLAIYRAEWQEPIGIAYHGLRVLECPPNGQGLAALVALLLVSDVDLQALPRESPECLHLLIEAMKCGMIHAARHVADPRFESTPVDVLLSEDFRRRHRPALPPERALDATAGAGAGSDTVYLAVVDPEGNAVSFINSIYGDFGSGHAVDGLGFLMQNRGAGFSLDPGHPNRLAPGKRPYHTIMPGLVLSGDALHTVFGVTGGFMQPQGHLQVLVNLIDFAMDVQSAVDAPRFWWKEGRRVVLEDGLPQATYDRLAGWGHEVVRQGHRGMGGAQVIRVWPERGVLAAGSEPRQDGCAIGF